MEHCKDCIHYYEYFRLTGDGEPRCKKISVNALYQLHLSAYKRDNHCPQIELTKEAIEIKLTDKGW